MQAEVSLKTGILIIVLLLGSSALPVAATSSDTGKEARWAEQVLDGLLDGDETWLVDDSGHKFLGIFTEVDAATDRAVILLHGVGVHPNWPDVIYPLREALLDQGITTLSLQMPVLANDADPLDYAPLFAEVPGRIDAALKFLHGAGYQDVTLVAHSMGASMAVYYLAQAKPTMVSSLVIIGMGPGLIDRQNIKALEVIKMPVLDLYGSDDLEAVLNSVELRSAAGAKGAGSLYRQTSVDGAGHFFQGHEEALQDQVYNWIKAQQQLSHGLLPRV
jgi:pimeloyl-ACP methyl ester carboxylesterase